MHVRTPLTADSNPTEYMPLAETYSPVLHRLDQAVRFRAVHPNEPIPPPYEILTRYSHPPDELLTAAKRQLRKLIEAANVKKGRSPSPSFPSPRTLTTPTKSPPKPNPANARAPTSPPSPAWTSTPSSAPPPAPPSSAKSPPTTRSPPSGRCSTQPTPPPRSAPLWRS